MTQLDILAETTQLVDQWDEEHNTAADMVSVLTRLAEIVEQETETYYKADHDPFDDRHPSRTDPSCTLGHVLKVILKNDSLMTHLTSTYFNTRDQPELHSTCCRLLLDLMPGVETVVIYKDNESTVHKLFEWAESQREPLSSYATGLLAGAMEIQDFAATFKEKNSHLVPVMLSRLWSYVRQSTGKIWSSEAHPSKSEDLRPFSQFASTECSISTKEYNIRRAAGEAAAGGVSMDSQLVAAEVIVGNKRHSSGVLLSESSNSSWAEMAPRMIGSYKMYPMVPSIQQRLILNYLIPMGEYQELLPHFFEHDAISLIFYYIDTKQNKDIRLAFAALRFLASLLCHKKFGVEFVQQSGVQKLLDVPRPSLAATGVSLCLFYLAFFEDTMERVCLLPRDVLSEMVDVVLWLLERSHPSGRIHAVMFCSFAFSFRSVLELSDEKDGLRKLINVVSVLDVLNSDSAAGPNFAEDQKFTHRQTMRHVLTALKKYFECHLILKAEHIHRESMHGTESQGSQLSSSSSQGSPDGLPVCKAIKLSHEAIQESLDVLLDALTAGLHWKPVSHFRRLSGIELLLRLIAISAEWPAYPGKAESIRCAFDILTVCTVVPAVQLMMCGSINLPDNVTVPAISIVLGMADTEILTEPEVQKSALNVLSNLVCAPLDRLMQPVAAAAVNGTPITASSSRKRTSTGRLRTSNSVAASPSGHQMLHKLWDEFRANNGIMVLLKLLCTKTPITDADAIRALACKCLVGLARSDTLCQIMSKLPMFSSGQLQQLMKEPILQDKRIEHVKFCKYASEIIERVCGKAHSPAVDASMEDIRKADVVAQTKIVYHEKELLQLIHGHLLAKGLVDAAAALQREACLPPSRSLTPTPSQQLAAAGHGVYASPSTSTALAATSQARATAWHAGLTPVSRAVPTTPSGSGATIRLTIRNSPSAMPRLLNSTARVKPAHSKGDTATSCYLSPANLKKPLTISVPGREANSLEKIVTSYLRKQHALCKNPVVTCPPFSLFEPHVCPEPKRKNTAPCNVAARMLQKQVKPPFGGVEGSRYDRKFVYSRFRPLRVYRDAEGDNCFSCCAFSACEQWLMLGTYTGDLKLYNVHTAEEAETYSCHNSPLTRCEPSRDGSLLLTSSSWGTPLSGLWTMNDFFDLRTGFDEDSYVEFSKQAQDRIVGTKDATAKLYDVTTGKQLLTLYDESKANNYNRNQATFNYTDDLVLNDGVLWDVNSGKAVHKFDKFNPTVSGVFHPMGLEVIINSEVWDLRTFHLLHTVPALDQCQIRFSHVGDVIYGAIIQVDDDEVMTSTPKSPYGSTFRTFDASDYSIIATTDVKKTIFDLCTDKTDSYLAIIENQRNEDTLSDESLCRLYEVGQVKADDDQSEDEEEEDNDAEDDDEDDDAEHADDDAEDEALSLAASSGDAAGESANSEASTDDDDAENNDGGSTSSNDSVADDDDDDDDDEIDANVFFRLG